MNVIAKQTITAAGGAQSVPMKDWKASVYHFSFRSVGATPLAGSTAVAATPTYGTQETVKYPSGSAVNVDPTALESFTIERPISECTFTPTSWTAGSALEVTVIADSPLSI
jgi:hypothetical protein